MFSDKHINRQKSELGAEGENEATKYLQRVGCRILTRNFRQAFGELDIVAKERNGTLVFVEVKTMRGTTGGLKPEDQMSSSKMKKLKKICEFFANKYPELVDEKRGWRIDTLCLTKIENNFEIKHYRNTVL